MPFPVGTRVRRIVGPRSSFKSREGWELAQRLQRVGTVKGYRDGLNLVLWDDEPAPKPMISEFFYADDALVAVS